MDPMPTGEWARNQDANVTCHEDFG